MMFQYESEVQRKGPNQDINVGITNTLMVFKVTGTDVVMKCKSLDIFFKKREIQEMSPQQLQK